MRLSLFALLDAMRAPAPQASRVAFLKSCAFAHRGLHDSHIPENSRAAFSAAVAGGFGIELDVRVSRDNDAFVFHDRQLDRLAEGSGRLSSYSSNDLDRIRLKGCDETIPRLADVLALVAGHVPLLIEVKTGRRSIDPLCRAVRSALEGYAGPAAVMSFNPDVSRWFFHHAPQIPRGLVVTEEGPTALPDKTRAAIKRRLALWRAKPDFLAYDIRDLPSGFATAQRTRGLPVLTWTVRSSDERSRAALHADAPIFEVGPS